MTLETPVLFFKCVNEMQSKLLLLFVCVCRGGNRQQNNTKYILGKNSVNKQGTSEWGWGSERKISGD